MWAPGEDARPRRRVRQREKASRLQRDPAAASGRRRSVDRPRCSWQGRDLLALPQRAMQPTCGAGEIAAMVFQEPMTALNPLLTDRFAKSAESLGVHLGLRGGAARRRAVEVARPRRNSRMPRRPPGQLPARVLRRHASARHDRHRLSRAGPKLLLADEPTTALDVTIQDQILMLLLKPEKTSWQMSVVLVTHDLGVVAEAPATGSPCCMPAGSWKPLPVADDLRRIRRTPTRWGCCVRMPGRRAGAARAWHWHYAGTPPDAARALPPGCRFAPRCALAIDAVPGRRQAASARPLPGRKALASAPRKR